MNIYHENDVIRLRKKVKATIIAGDETLIPEGTVGTIVLVHGNAGQPFAYEVEFFIHKQSVFALATVEPELISKD